MLRLLLNQRPKISNTKTIHNYFWIKITMVLNISMHFSCVPPLVLQAMANGYYEYGYYVFSVDNEPNRCTLHACMMLIIALSSLIGNSVVVVWLNSNNFI